MPITVSATTTPTEFEPVNAPMWFIFTGFTSGLDNFNYVININRKIEPFSITSEETFGPYKIPPRPNTGEGWFTPNKILKGAFENSINPFAQGFSSPNAQYIQYDLDYGWEYNPNTGFTGTFSGSGGNLGLIVVDNTNFQVGDIIKLSKDNKAINSSYDGIQEILTLSGSTGMTVNTPYGIAVTNESGSITLHSRITGSTGTLTTYNGTRQYNQRTVDFGDIYLIDVSSSVTLENFLYTYPEPRKKVFIDAYETLSFIATSTSGYSVTVERFDINGNVIGTVGGTDTLVSAGTLRRRWNFGVGPQNIIDQTGNANYFDNVAYYTVRVTTSGITNTVSETITFEIVPNCLPYDNYRIVFLNRVGGYEYFDFKMNSKKTTQIERTEYGKILDWDYSMGDRGRDILAVKATENFEISTDWVTQNEIEWLEQLLTSPDVYVIRNNELHPIIITDTTYESKNVFREQIFNLTLRFKYAYNINLQNL
jgi:hypothetical protein